MKKKYSDKGNSVSSSWRHRGEVRDKILENPGAPFGSEYGGRASMSEREITIIVDLINTLKYADFWSIKYTFFVWDIWLELNFSGNKLVKISRTWMLFPRDSM